MNIKTKVCTKCGTEHTGTKDELNRYFSWNNKSKRILNSLCKDCNRKRCRNFRNDNKDKYNDIASKWRQENKDYSSNRNAYQKQLSNLIDGNLSIMTECELQEMAEILSNRLTQVRKQIRAIKKE
ncbi:MAG: hypothetical protein ACRCX8_02920 [Sarcina sp.]